MNKKLLLFVILSLSISQVYTMKYLLTLRIGTAGRDNDPAPIGSGGTS